MNDPDSQINTQAKLTHEEILRLPHIERIRYVESIRIRFPLWEKLYNKIQRCHELKAIVAEPSCMLLVGPTGAGKTTLAASYARKYPPIFTETVTLRPVVMATIPSTANVHNLIVALLEALGDPGATKGRSIGAKERRLLKYFKEACKVELLILDELQHFVDRDNQKILLNASNWLKTFIKETMVSCLLIGLQNDAEEVVNSNPQLARLFGDPYVLAPFEWDEAKPDGTKEVFRDFLREIEKLLPLKEPSHLAQYDTALRCFVASGGIMSYQMKLIRTATHLALQRRNEHLDLNLLAQAFKEELASGRRGIPNPFIGGLPNLEEIKKNQAKLSEQEKRNGRGTNRRGKPRNPDDPPQERLKDIL
jgi:Bacterial TniB protein